MSNMIITFLGRFFSIFIIVYIIYQLVFILPKKKSKTKSKVDKLKRKKKEKNEIIEIRYLILRYKLDIKKVNYNQLLQIVALVSSVDIALITTIEMMLESSLFQILVVFILVWPVFMFSYYLVFKFYEKKGMIKNV